MRRAVFVALICAVPLAACEREARRFAQPAPNAATAKTSPTPGVTNPAESNAYEVAQGKRLFSWYNCVGCHAHGGGGSGPALMDDKWLYGADPGSVFRSIVEGRPNGMPAFGTRIPEGQVWQLVAYVRSLSGQVRFDVAPSRDDSMQPHEPESREETLQPKVEK